MPAFNLPGFGGLIHLLTEFRSLTDAMVAELPFPVLQINNTGGAWPEYYRDILNFLELPLNGHGNGLVQNTQNDRDLKETDEFRKTYKLASGSD